MDVLYFIMLLCCIFLNQLKRCIMTVGSSVGTTRTEDHCTGWLKPDEFVILELICDTFLPSLEPPRESSEALSAFYRRCAGDLNVASLVAERLARENAQTQTEFRQ